MGKRILIIDDSKTSRREIAKIVNQHGFKAFEADNGRWGLELIQIRGDFAMVFCDVVMPLMNGREFVEAFRKLPEHGQTPLIMMSSTVTPETMQPFQNFSVNSWLSKPFQAVQVRELLQAISA